MRSVALVLGLALAAPAAGQHTDHAGNGSQPGDSVPLYDSLGTLSRTVTTTSPLAQRYFDQGLRLTYGFGHGDDILAALDESELMQAFDLLAAQ